MVCRKHLNRHLDADGMVAETSNRIAADRIAECAQRTKFQAIEYGAQVDEERIISLTGENLDAARKIINRFRRQVRFVVRCGPRSDVVRRSDKTRTENGCRKWPRVKWRAGAASVAHGYGIGLLYVEIGITKRSDDRIPTRGTVGTHSSITKVREERIGVRDRCLKFELEVDVGYSIAGVVDIDVVQDVWIEVEKSRTTRGSFHRNVVGYDRNRIGAIGTHERVQIGIVCERIIADQWRFPMARSGY